MNLAVQSAKGKDIDSSQFNFTPADWPTSPTTTSISTTSSSTPPPAAPPTCGTARVSARISCSARACAPTAAAAGRDDRVWRHGIPNGAHLPYYTQVNLGADPRVRAPAPAPLTARFDVINAFDDDYQIRNGTGVGVGAPQYGPRRGIFAGLALAL